jgi:hypothetical protein
MQTTTKLEPGQTFDLNIRLVPGQATSTRQSVGIKCYEEGTSATFRFVLDLLANQRQSMNIIPKFLDFGLVVPGEEVNRVITFREVPTDRFSISKIDVGTLPLTFTTQETTALDGMNHYQIDLRFNLKDEKIEGKQQSEIVFSTDSHQYPVIKIPVIYEAAPFVYAVPSIVSFGTIKVKEKTETEIEFESRNGSPVDVKVELLPDGVTFEKNDNVYRVGFMANNTGIWRDEIKLILTSGGQHIPLSLKCVAFVQETVSK